MSAKNQSKENRPNPNVRGRHTISPGYEAGNHWVVCDSCGFDIRAKDIRMTWDGRAVCPADWEVRHPQDFVRSREDDMRAKGPVRPEPTAIFLGGPCPTSAISGIAICGIAVCGIDCGRPVLTEVPGGTFNMDTL